MKRLVVMTVSITLLIISFLLAVVAIWADVQQEQWGMTAFAFAFAGVIVGMGAIDG